MNPYFSIGPITVYYYGLILAVALLVGYFYARRRAPRYNIPTSLIDNALFVIAPLGILGARLYFVLFNLDYYLQSPGLIFDLRGGGLAIHGALIGGGLGAALVWWWHRRKTLPHFWNLLDVIAPVLLLSQAIGRLANYVNREAFGTPTDLPWGITIPSDRRPAEFIQSDRFHPTFAYEAIWNLVGLPIILYVERRLVRAGHGPTNAQPPSGILFAVYLGWYSLGRFWIEGLRTDALYLGPVRIAQLVSAILFLGSLGYIWYRTARWRTVTPPRLASQKNTPAS